MAAGLTAKITPEEMQKTFVTYEKSLLTIPMYRLAMAKPFLHVISGVRYQHKMSELAASMELAPWDPMRQGKASVDLKTRTLETYLGNNCVTFDPTSDVYQSIWGSNKIQEGLENTPYTLAVWQGLFAALGEGLFNAIFTAKRNDSGDSTADLFNGLATIADTEIAAGNISTANGNYLEVDAITRENAVDIFESIYDALDPKLKSQDVTILCHPNYKLAYERCYRDTYGTVAYNKEFNKTFIEGSRNKCKIETLENVPEDFIQCTVDGNACLGLATDGENCTFDIRPSIQSQFMLDFVASMFMGTQYRSIKKEYLLIAKVKSSTSASTEQTGE